MKQKRLLVISDIHGCNRSLQSLLEIARYDSNKDKLLLLGDYVDRGPRSKEAVIMVMHLVKECGAIALQGNHDHRFVNVMKGTETPEERTKFFEKGGIVTLQSYLGEKTDISPEELGEYRTHISKEYDEHIQFLDSLPLYHEDDHFIYVHAGLNPDYSDWRSQPVKDFLYIREPFYTKKTHVEKTVVFGHTLTRVINGSADVWFGGDKIGIDGGCAYGYQLNSIEIVDGEIVNVYSKPFADW